MIPLWQRSASELVEGYRLGKWSPVEAIDSVLARLGEINPSLNAVIALNAGAREAAEHSRLRYMAGKPLSQLDGVPISIKDNLLMAGLPATWGCRALKDHQPEVDELPVGRLRAQGAVLFGKTNVPEFTLEGHTDNALFGTTRNPWNTALTPGGSSGGAVAAVAAGIGPLALCTDGGGSIRRPSAHTGLVGLKPSIGAIARGNGFPSLLLDFEVVGPVGRNVADVKIMFDALFSGQPEGSRSRCLPAKERPVRVLYVPTLGDSPTDPCIRSATDEAASVLTWLGCEVEKGPLALELSEINESWPEIGQIGLAHLLDLFPQWRAQISSKYLAMARSGERIPASRLWACLERVQALRQAVGVLFETWDFILTPTTAALAWPAAEAYPVVIDDQAVGPRGHAIFTGWVNVAGNAAISLPAVPADDGLPTGIQLIGPWGSERDLLALAARYEAMQPWATRFERLWSVG